VIIAQRPRRVLRPRGCRHPKSAWQAALATLTFCITAPSPSLRRSRGQSQRRGGLPVRQGASPAVAPDRRVSCWRRTTIGSETMCGFRGGKPSATAIGRSGQPETNTPARTLGAASFHLTPGGRGGNRWLWNGYCTRPTKTRPEVMGTSPKRAGGAKEEPVESMTRWPS
jgi:hypothetical protein